MIRASITNGPAVVLGAARWAALGVAYNPRCRALLIIWWACGLARGSVSVSLGPTKIGGSTVFVFLPGRQSPNG